MEGLEALPTLAVRYRGIVRQEFDLDAALARRPAILLVDELAHSNLVGGEPAPRHPKRWQDIEELLEAGIDVWTTVNVQHLESLNDLVAQITGVRQQRDPAGPRLRRGRRSRADRPAARRSARAPEGRQGLHAGRQPDARSTDSSARPNLIALRELALRRMTDRVEAAARDLARRRPDVARAGWRAIACWWRSGPTRRPSSWCASGKRIADALDADWTVVYVETPALLTAVGEGAQSPHRCAAARRVARRGDRDARRAVRRRRRSLEYATTRNATRVLVGAPKRRGWRALLRPSTATRARAARARLRRHHDCGGRRAPSHESRRPDSRHGRGDDAAAAPQALRMGGSGSRSRAPRSLG